MKKKFFINLLFLIALNLIVKPFWVLGIDRVVQNQVGTSDYGMYFSLFNLSFLFNIILDLGLTNFNNRNIAQYNQLLPKFFSNIVVLKFLLGFVYAFVVLIIGYSVGYDAEQFRILFFLILNQFLLSFILYLRSNISALHYFKIDSMISILDRILMIILIGIALWGNVFKQKFQIEWFIYAQTISYSVTVITAFSIVLYFAKKIRIRINKAFLISTLKQTMPYATLVFLMLLYTRSDSFILERLIPDGKIQVGIYAQSYRLLDAVSQFSFLFAGLLLPIFSKMIKQKQNVGDLVRFSFFLLLVPGIIVVISSIFYNNEIISLLYTEHYEVSSQIFSIIIATFIPISIAYIFGTLLTANGSLKKLNIIALVGVAINLILNFTLIPSFKALGTAVTALTTQSVTAIIQMIIAINLFKIRVSAKKIFSILSYLIIFVSFTYLIHNLLTNWILGYVLCILLGVGLGFLFKLLNLKMLLRLLKGFED